MPTCRSCWERRGWKGDHSGFRNFYRESGSTCFEQGFQHASSGGRCYATELDAARLLTRRAAAAKDTANATGSRYGLEAAIAKLYAAEMAQRVTTKALQIHGGYGYTKEYPVERNFRDARITEIYEGTSEIHRLIIAREIFKDSGVVIG